MTDHVPPNQELSPTPPDPGQLTQLIEGAERGQPEARDQLLREVYEQLRALAGSHLRSERSDHTLGATALVNETYLRLFREAGERAESRFAHRRAFYQAATTAMRRILIDHARAKLASKRSGGKPGEARRGRVSEDVLVASETAHPADLLALDEALGRLEAEDERAASVVRLRFFGGRTLLEIAEILGVSDRTVKRDWEFARARLQMLIEAAGERDDGS